MNTQVLLPVCLVVGLYAAWKSGAASLKTNTSQKPQASLPTAKQIPVTTLLLVIAIALPTTLQFIFPEMLLALRRDYTRFASGEWWRMFTPLFVQDAGMVGAAFNLVSLALVGGVAEQLWGRWRMLAVFFMGGIASEVVAFSWQPLGAGNSVGNFSLAAGIAVTCLSHRPGRAVLMTATLALCADAVLLMLQDIHGAAALVGALLTVLLGTPRSGTQKARLAKLSGS